ncbi:MAG TPA: EAL domain-containing protein [Thermoleophilaceae bacterium]
MGEHRSTAARLLSTQRAINSHLAALKPPSDLVPDLIATICEWLDWSFGAFWTPTAENGAALEAVAVWHEESQGLADFAERCRASLYRRGEGVLGRIWERAQPRWLSDFDGPGLPRAQSALEVGLRSAFAFPIQFGGEFRGILEFFSDEERGPDQELLENAQVVGDQLAQYLERWRVLEEQRRLAAIVESTDDAILTKDRNRIITSWNAGAERLYGYSAEEAVGESVTMLIPETRVGEEVDILDRVITGERVTRYETERLRKDGSIVEVSLTASPVRDAHGAAIGASVIAHDITTRREAERAVIAERDRAESYLQMAGSILVAGDPGGCVTMINRAGLDVLGRSEDEVIGADWFELVLPEELRDDLRSRFRTLMTRGASEGSMSYYETPVLTKAGEERIVAWMTSVMRDSGGRVTGVLSSGSDITERLKSEAAVAHLAYHDQLTGLANRVLLEEHLEVALARAARENRELALLYLDLDNFKMVNDSLGHAAGDRLLEMVAERLSGATRGSDVVARHGGDEFLILLSELEGDTAHVAEAVASKILTVLEEPFTMDDAEFEVGASIGIAICPRDGETASALLRSADAAMYQAKAGGRSRYAVHRDAERGGADRLSLTARLRRGLAQNELILHYQPIFSVPDRRLAAVEALVRWDDPERGLVGPSDFVPLAEDTGLIEPIGEWVIRTICEQAREWSRAGLHVRIHFNLSPRQLRQRRAVEAIRDVIESGGIAPELLTAEITESTAMAEAEVGHSILSELRELGLNLSVDDFGSGYSSLGRLRQLPVNELKLDRSFLRSVPYDPEAGALVRGVLDLAGGLGMDAVVEGVESSEQWDFLVRHGRALAQGFHLARPAPADELTPLLEQAQRAA